MANSTFSGPVRSENGFSDITKNTTTGAVTSTMTLQTYEATITVAVTTAAANAVNLVDIGTDADTDGFVDGISAAVNSTGFKGFFGCNGVLGMSGFTTSASGATPDEVEIVVSGDPGGDTVIVLKFFGISSSSDAS